MIGTKKSPSIQNLKKFQKNKKPEINDKRFTEMFSNKKFSEGLDFDIRGNYQKEKKSNNRNKELEKYYSKKVDHEKEEFSEEEESVEDIESNVLVDENIDIDMEKERQKDTEKPEGEDYTSDTSEEFEEFLEAQNQDDEDDDPFETFDQKGIPNGEETKRLSVMNLDWDNIHANDLFVLFTSFISGKSKIYKVEIYPSEYGLKEMQKEKTDGPDKEIFRNGDTHKSKGGKYKNPRKKIAI